MSMGRKDKSYKASSSGHVVEPEEICLRLEEQQQKRPTHATTATTTSSESQESVEAQRPLQQSSSRQPRLKSQTSDSLVESVGDGSVKSSSERRYSL